MYPYSLDLCQTESVSTAGHKSNCGSVGNVALLIPFVTRWVVCHRRVLSHRLCIASTTAPLLWDSLGVTGSQLRQNIYAWPLGDGGPRDLAYPTGRVPFHQRWLPLASHPPITASHAPVNYGGFLNCRKRGTDCWP